MLRSLSQNQIALLALTVWFLINLLQSIFTPLHGDEVYFWTYGWNPAWGYWDHAPMIGWLNFLGQMLLPYQELGVRLFTVLLNTATVWILWRLTDRQDARLFFLLIFGMAFMHLGGFMSSPDSPLAFFNATLLASFAAFQNRSNWKNGLIVGLAAALVLYSKYHGAMLIGMLAISQPRLWKKWTFWLAVGTTVALIFPMVHWLIENDWGTFRYHIIEKDPVPYQVEWTLSYLVNQFVIIGPFLGFLLIPLIFVYRPQTSFLKSARIAVFGIWTFLLLLSFKTMVLGNWSAAALPPFLLLSYAALRQRQKWYIPTIRLAAISAIILFSFRIYLMTDLPLPKDQQVNYRGWRGWAAQIKEKADDLPVVFINSYQLPSRYAFETKTREVFALSNYFYHATQYDFSGIEETLQGRKVMMVYSYHVDGSDSIVNPVQGKFYFNYCDDFCSFQRVKMRVPDPPGKMMPCEKRIVQVDLIAPNDDLVDFGRCQEYSFYPAVMFRQKGVLVGEARVFEDFWLDEIRFTGSTSLYLELEAPGVPGKYDLLFTMVTDWDYPQFGKHGRWLPMNVIDPTK